MKTKFLSILAVLFVSALGGYTFWHSDTIHKKLENPQSNTQTQSTHISTSNTTERIKTYSSNDGQWGKSPFSRGPSLSGVVTSGVTTTTKKKEKIIFQPSNTNWKARNVTLADGRVINYQFGNGNPTEVALMPDQILDIINCGPSAQDSTGYCPEGKGYITALYETKLKEALEHPYWEKLITECAYEYKPLLYDGRFEKYVISGNGRDINNLLTVDPVTGRKEPERDSTNTWNIGHLKNAVISVAGQNQDTGEWPSCMGKYSPTIIQLLQQLEGIYVSAGGIDTNR